MADRPIFEVVTPAVSAEARRLCTVAAVEAVMEDADIPNTAAEIEAHIDAVSAQMARLAGLAADAAGTVPTFASEVCRATWYAAPCSRGVRLLLPWRVPVTAIVSVVEDGVTLSAGTDFVLEPAGMILRLASDCPSCWSSAKIVINFTAGWTLPSGAPPELSAACAQQVKYAIMAKDDDPALRSYTVNDIRSETFNVPGGDSITKSGLLVQVDAALAPYRSIAI